MRNKLKWLWKYYKKHPWVIFVLVVLTPVQAVFQVAIPRMIDFTIDFLDSDKIPDDQLAIVLANLGSSFDLSPSLSFGLGFILLGLIATIFYFIVQSHRAWMNLRLEWHFRHLAGLFPSLPRILALHFMHTNICANMRFVTAAA